MSHIPLWKSIDRVLDADEKIFPMEIPLVISSNLRTIMNLMSSAKDRAILQFVLGAIYSNTQLRIAFGCKNTNEIRREVQEFITQSEVEANRSKCLSEEEFSKMITKLTHSIENSEGLLERKRKRLSEEEIDDREFDIANKKRRLNDMHQRTIKRVKLQLAKKHFNKWKRTLKVQSGKKQGKYSINRGAELAIYSVLAEQLKAHRRRWGDEGTGYVEADEKRLHKREMRRIANKYLSAKGLPLIKSTETVRSWGRPTNKSSRQAKQHRGRNLWSYVKSQKKHRQRHINVHYNRAHIKHYTRLAFGKSFDLTQYVVRRAMDDKAYVRCGTSEGFSRPLHRPVQPAATPFELPSSDYPDTVGYVSPGVILLVNEMEEVEHLGRDRFTQADVTVTVTCKPKHLYLSSATNWANDMFSTRYCFRKEHELEKDSSESDTLPDEVMDILVMLRDTLLQYELMSIPEDYLKASEGGDHLAREQLRHHVLIKRLELCLSVLHSAEAVQPMCIKIGELKDEITKIGNNLFIHNDI